MRLLFLDIESEGLRWKSDKIHGVGWATEEDGTCYEYFPEGLSAELLELLADPNVAVIGSNIRFDLRFLIENGVTVNAQPWDLKLLAQLIDENGPLGLKDLTARYLGKDHLSDKAELDRVVSLAGIKHVGDLCRLDLANPGSYYDTVSGYCQEDVNNSLKLFYVLIKKLKLLHEAWLARGAKKTLLDYLKEEALPVEAPLLHMEVRGIKVDFKAVEETRRALELEHEQLLRQLGEENAEKIAKIEEELFQKAREKRKTPKGKAGVQRRSDAYQTRFLWSSSSHVGKLIYEGFEVPERLVSRTKSGLYSTGDAELTALKGALPPEHALQAFLATFGKLRASQKLITTYIAEDSGLLADVQNGRVHSLYLQAGSSKEGGVGGTATGRLSSQSPNMQNIPRTGGIKKFFVPDSPESVFAYLDYSQVELRIAAHLSQDEELLSAYQRGIDLHALTASGIFRKDFKDVTKEERQAAKTVNFAMIYDAKGYRLWQELGPLGYSLEACEEMREAFFIKYAGYLKFLKQVLKYVKETSCVISECGRVRRLPDIHYGEALNWARKTVDCTPEMYAALKHNPTEKLAPQEAFIRAKKRYNHAMKQAYNFPIQSLGASITKRAMIKLYEQGYDLVTQVHDSITIQLPKHNAIDSLADIRHTMERTYQLTVPLVAEGKLVKSLDESDKALSLAPTREVSPEDSTTSPRNQEVLKSNKG